MKRKILSIAILSGVIMTAAAATVFGQGDDFKIILNKTNIESMQEIQAEKVKGYRVEASVGENGFVIKPEFNWRDEKTIDKIFLKNIGDKKDVEIDISDLNSKYISCISESMGKLYIEASGGKKYQIDTGSGKIKDVSKTITKDEYILASYDDGLVLTNSKTSQVRLIDQNLVQTQDIHLPIRKGQDDIFYINYIKFVNREGSKIKKVYYVREKLKKEGHLGLDEIVARTACVYDVSQGQERELPFGEHVAMLDKKQDKIFIEEYRGDDIYLVQKDESGKTIDEEFLYNMDKGYLRTSVEISPNGKYGLMNFIRTFGNDESNTIQELYLIDIENHKKKKIMDFEKGEGNINRTTWSQNSKSIGINLRNITKEAEYVIVNIEDIN